jgi:hypothetical protein
MWHRQFHSRARGCLGLRFVAPFALLAALAVAGCANSDPTVTGSIPANHSQTIAFESVDGPPRPVFDRLVSALAAEAEQRELPVVTHTGPSAYRVRAYLATFIEKKKKRALGFRWVPHQSPYSHVLVEVSIPRRQMSVRTWLAKWRPGCPKMTRAILR